MEIIKESNSNLLLCYEKRNIDYLMETTEGEMAKNYLLKIDRKIFVVKDKNIQAKKEIPIIKSWLRRVKSNDIF